MAQLIWTDDLDTGVAEIDCQHRRIFDLINRVHRALSHGETAQSNGVSQGRDGEDMLIAPLFQDSNVERSELGAAIDEVVDYTLTHFAFEEGLMEMVDYPFYAAHKKVHDAFRQRIVEYLSFFREGEDVADELLGMLTNWLFNHIRCDDKVMVGRAKEKLLGSSTAENRPGLARLAHPDRAA